MSWAKVKNIMIIILIAMNLFLLVDIAFTEHASTSLPKGTGENFSKVLEKNGISIEKSAIPRYYETRRELSADFYDIDYLTKIFIKSQVNYISDGSNVIARTENKCLTVTGVSFEYTNGEEGVKKNGDKIIKALEQIGLNTYGAEFVEDEGLVKVFIDGMEVEGIYLNVKLNEQGEIVYIKGVWSEITGGATKDKVSVISAIHSICSTVPSGAEISKIEPIYLTDNQGKSCNITPGWKIYTENASYSIN